MLGVCSPVQGKLSAVIQVLAGELAGSKAHGPLTPTSTHTVQVSATIVVPEVR